MRPGRARRVSLAPSCFIRALYASLHGKCDKISCFIRAGGPSASCFIRAFRFFLNKPVTFRRLTAQHRGSYLVFHSRLLQVVRVPNPLFAVFFALSRRVSFALGPSPDRVSFARKHIDQQKGCFPQSVEVTCLIRAFLVFFSRLGVFDSRIVVFHSQGVAANYSS